MKKVMRFLPIVVCLFFTIIAVWKRDELSVQSISRLVTENVALSALILLLLYALKSLSVAFPIAVLEVVAGIVFPLPIALLLNLIGIVIVLTIPYHIGRLSGHDLADQIIGRNKWLERISEYQSKNAFFVSFLLRVIAILPGDIVSMYLGASGIRFPQFLTGCLLGALPRMIAYTIAGDSIMTPNSPAFIISVLLSVLLAVISFAVHYHLNRLHDEES
ncbi:MAG: VTT domain-containing protein [Lachnospiraceae bacterium]|nr:VTT domain-containing protein [Lachnospiraceae bacterium]